MMKLIFRGVLGRFFWYDCSEVLSYKGSWRNGQFHGKGQLKYKNGTVFKGNFSKGSKHGSGCLVSNTGYIYNGDWVLGRQTGAAEIKYKNGDGYTGQVLNGLRHGLGKTLIAATGETVTCHWEQDTVDGRKDISIASKDWYFEGALNGSSLMSGKIIYADKSSYVGEMKNFRRAGKGTLITSSGELITGFWTDEFNVQNARRVDPKGVIWKGELRNLKPQGLMHVKLPSGKKYDGQWDNGYLKRVLSVRNCDGTHAPYIVH